MGITLQTDAMTAFVERFRHRRDPALPAPDGPVHFVTDNYVYNWARPSEQKKKQRVAYYETKPMIGKFKVLGQPITSELGLITQKINNAILPITLFLSRLESPFNDQNVSCGL